MDIETIEKGIEKLRREWVSNPAKREIISRQARCLVIAKEKLGMKKQENSSF